MNNPRPSIDIGKFIAWLIENAVFVGASILLFSKTSDLMTAFAPNTFMGYKGVEGLYGFASACLVEGVFVLMKFQLSRTPHALAWLWNVILIFLTFTISALAQSIDSFVVKETLDNQPPEVQLLVQWGVPMIPSIIVFAVLLKTVVDTLPPDFMRQFSGGQGQGQQQKQSFQPPKPSYQPQPQNQPPNKQKFQPPVTNRPLPPAPGMISELMEFIGEDGDEEAASNGAFPAHRQFHNESGSSPTQPPSQSSKMTGGK